MFEGGAKSFGGLMRSICVNCFEFDPAFRPEMFNFCFYFSSVGHFVWRSKIIWAIYGRGPYMEHSFEIILNLG